MPSAISFLDDDHLGFDRSAKSESSSLHASTQPAHRSGYDSDDTPDISSALLGPSTSRSSAESGRGSGKNRRTSAPAVGNTEQADEDDEAFIVAATQRHNRKAGTDLAKDVAKSKGKGKNKTASGTLTGGGSFQSMGLPPQLLRSILLRGYTTPTPIQRLAIPSLLDTPARDLVGMARTGSGKTLAYMLPLLNRLGGKHSTTVGIRSLVLCPSRELALQILRVGKEIARGWKVPDSEPLRWALIVGGEGMEEQFALMASNPDVVIATPGRLLHLAVEAKLNFSSVQFVVFDEADRLFEMGFADQLEELIKRMPPTRQTALFSATLPKTLVEFARAGLAANPKLVRLDADSKISQDLRMAFFSVKPSEKEAALLVLLRDVIGVPQGLSGSASSWPKEGKGKRRAAPLIGTDELQPHQTIIFCATKHHVEYLLALLGTAGWSCAHIYSSLDQAARTQEMIRFRTGDASLLIVTDVAARGIDLPSMTHVVNYDLPASPRIFIHRVGRTARAGRSGWAWSLVGGTDLPYLCDLQLFLARPLMRASDLSGKPELDLHNNLQLGTFPRSAIDIESEHIMQGLHNSSSSASVALPSLKTVVGRAQKLYDRSASKASQESHRRAKAMLKGDDEWCLAGNAKEELGVHDVVVRPSAYGLSGAGTNSLSKHRGSDGSDDLAAQRAALLAKVNSFTPQNTVFEVGTKGPNPLSDLMRDRRATLDAKRARAAARDAVQEPAQSDGENGETEFGDVGPLDEMSQAGESDIEDVFDVADKSISKKSAPKKKSAPASRSYRDPEYFMAYEHADAANERGYSMGHTDSFAAQASKASYSLAGDEARLGTQTQAPNASRWDVKKKRFTKGDGTGENNEKYIRTESGTRLPASFQSGRYEEWKKSNKVNVQKVGEREDKKSSSAALAAAGRGRGGSARGGRGGGEGRTFRHHSSKEAREPDRFRDDYQKQLKRKRGREAGDGGHDDEGGFPTRARGSARGARGSRGARGGRGRGGLSRADSRVASSLKSAAQIQKTRQLEAKRKAKNARGGRGGGKKRGVRR
ncbi:DEAD-domain-containing protein [Ceraceosorus guamensis]|uniref:RNA helicase n=1 Tax=Ceraceosorus guamensis TaxID=1522189 RepID=A0A316W1N6_9BASI|nr:DEAD-domain-containing protein [Ceraceosorus guamensis]PWN43652.1 DEAD-domain-containing protein [Ceraceosorus guamensis]